MRGAQCVPFALSGDSTASILPLSSGCVVRNLQYRDIDLAKSPKKPMDHEDLAGPSHYFRAIYFNPMKKSQLGNTVCLRCEITAMFPH